MSVFWRHERSTSWDHQHAFGETIPRLVETVDIKILKSVHNKLVKPTLQPVKEGITGVTLHCLFKNKPVSVRPNKVLLPDPSKVRFEVTRLDFLGRLWSEILRHVAKLLQFILVSCSCSFISFVIIDAGFPPELAENANGIFSFGQRLYAFTVRTVESWTPRLFSRFFVIVQSQAHFISRGTHFIYVDFAKSLVRAEKSEVFCWLISLSPGMKLERLSLRFESWGFRSRGSLPFHSPDKLLLAERRISEAELNNTKTLTCRRPHLEPKQLNMAPCENASSADESFWRESPEATINIGLEASATASKQS